MMRSTFFFSLLAGTAFAQLAENNLKTHVGSLKLSAPFNPIKEAYWTGLPHHRRTPFAVSPDGKSAYLAYLDASETDVHIQKVDPATFAAVGDAVTVTGGKEAGGLVAHNDGFALLTNEAMPSGTTNAPPDSTPVAVLYRYTAGKQTFKTFLGGPDNVGGMGALASPDMNGDLAFSEATGMYGAYFVVTAYSGDAKGHFGDAIQYVSENGTLEQIQGASSSWGCSHNTGIAFEAADSVPFPSICSEDQGAIWLNTGGTGMDKSGVKVSNENVQNGAGNEAMGGMSGSYSGLARFIDSDSYIFSWVSRGAKDLTENEWMGAGYTHSENRTVNRNVAIATFSDKKTIVGEQATSELGPDGDSQVNWITTGSADCQNAHVAAFDGTSALVTWEEIAEPTCEFIAMGCKGAFTGSYFQLVKDGKKVGEPVKSMDVYVAGDMVTMADGRVCWPYVDMDWTLDAPVRSPANVEAISFACMGLSGNESAAPASSAPAASAPAASKTPAPSSKAPVATSAAVKESAPVNEVAESTEQTPAVETPAEYAPTPAPNPIESLLPIAPIVSVITSALEAIPSGFLPDNDLPAPFLSIFIPASESFIASLAPAFTESAKIPLLSLEPVYSSTPSSLVAEPTAEPTAYPEYPEAIPIVEPSQPAVTPTAEPTQPAASTTCTEGKTQSTRVPLDATLSADAPPYPIGTGSAAYPTGSGMRPSGIARPTGAGRPDWFHGSRPDGSFGWGRPRPSDMWPAYGYPHPTAGFHYPSKPSEAFGHGGAAGVKASSKPCTLETRVRPTPTALVR
ncbi:hypothetical protein AA0114_g5561 [Alternaria tenuissima]|uniref:Uncharacterized protein n=1 Tax=Alternaria tenuissima TaxID=119927 RepID=A0A4Q4MJ61_9PLEO|nr:hypothetical protein AA0114_g5561 [Alternaria tenuissima]